jgi:hypothetical protein
MVKEMIVMKNIKVYPIALFAAAAALVACSKTEVAPVQNDTLAEITYETAPVTKTIEKFADGNIFSSIAYYHTGDWDWTATGKSIFIGSDEDDDGSADGVAISKIGNAWKNADRKYYWPKNGKLTFFAWSLNSSSLVFPDAANVVIYCTPAQGVGFFSFNIDKNKNVDFMVADVASNKTANEKQYVSTSGVESGVPTLFKHKFSKFYFTVKEKEDYEGVKMTLNTIVFKNLANTASYAQHPDDAVSAMSFSKSDQTYTDGDAAQEITATAQPIATDKVDQTIYLPQTFASDTAPIGSTSQIIEITYTIEYTTSTGGTIKETVTEQKKLCELFPDAATSGAGIWEKGKKYTLNLVFALDEILWDPAVEDWATEENTVEVPQE